MVAEGAAIIDVGGESTRPGAEPVPLQQELDRVIPLIERLRAEVDVVISIDTMKPEVMRAAVAAGADLVNDVLALQSPGALQAVAATGAAVCLMHMQGTPRTMQAEPHYDDVVAEVAGIPAAPRAGLCRRRHRPRAHRAGSRIRLRQVAAAQPGPAAPDCRGLAGHGYPVLAGLSRKAILGKLLGRSVEHRLAGSLALATIAVQRGARIIRSHDIAPTCDAVAVAWAAA